MHLLSTEEDPNSAVECLSNLLYNQGFGEKKAGSLNKFQVKKKLVSLNLVVVGILFLIHKIK